MASLESQTDRPPFQDNGHAFNLDVFIAKYGVELRSIGAWNGGRKFVLERCVWNPEHNDKSAYIVQFENGAIAAGCHHNGCQGKGWRDLRDLFEPDRAAKTGSHQNGTQAGEASRKGSGQKHEQDASQPIDL
jgi:hypothetical protein